MNKSGTTPKARLSLLDSMCIVVGIIVGSGIYEVTPTVAAQFPHWSHVIGIWILGGLLSLAGALCYAELTSSYPNDGGDYIYLNRAYGSITSFLFAWSRTVIIGPGSIAAMAFPFATYAVTIWNPFTGTSLEDKSLALISVIVILTLTAVNSFRIDFGTRTQNILSITKVIGLIIILVLPLLNLSSSPNPTSFDIPQNLEIEKIGLALILVLFTFGGWSEISFVAGEVRNPNKNLHRTLVGGVILVTTLYILLNSVFLVTLGHSGVASSESIAADAVSTYSAIPAATLVSILICISTLGAVQGLIFTGARISYAFGKDYSYLKHLGHWNEKQGGPVTALWLQAFISVLIVLFAGSFNDTLVYTTTVVWFFYCLTGLSIFVLRKKDKERNRPYKTLGYPVTVLVFCASCLFLTYSAFVYNSTGSIISICIALFGLPIFILSKKSY